MNPPLEEILEIVRRSQDAERAWNRVLSLCRRSEPSKLWNALPAPDFAKDVARATRWLNSQISTSQDTTGIYLGLDTLNMAGRKGMNVEFGSSERCDPLREEIDWVFQGLRYGDSHLIAGLRNLHKVYSRPMWGESSISFADYVLFLGYSGIILGRALDRISTQCTFLAVWGFHDGDLFILGRKTPKGFTLQPKQLSD